MHDGRVVDEYDERRWRHADLGGIEDLRQPVADVRWRMRPHRVHHQTVQLAGRHTPVSLLRHAQRLPQDALDALPAQRRCEDDVGPGQVRSVPPQALQPLIGGVLVLLDRVPLVDDEDDPLVRLEHVADDVRVLCGVALARIGHDDRHVGGVDGLHRAQHAVALDPLLDRAASADAGRVDQHHGLPVELDRRIDRIAGGARHVGHDHSLAAEHAVDEGRLAGVRAPDDRNARRTELRLRQLGHLLLGQVTLRGRCRRLARHRRREVVDDEIGQIAGIAAVLGADGDRRIEAERVELDRIGLARRVVALVDHEDHRRVCAA